MLPIFPGRAPNNAEPLNRSHPLFLAGMVAAYRFIPPLSNSYTVRDLCGNGLDATLLINARIYGPDGPTLGSSARQSTGQFPRIPATIWNYVTGPAITIGFWAKFNAFPNIGAVIDSSTRDFSLYVGSGSSTATTCEVYRAGTGSGTITLDRTLQQDQWYRWLVGVQSNGDITVWIDGTSAGTDTVGIVIPSDGDTIDLGNNTAGGGNQFDGQIGDVFIWNVKLTDELAALDYKEAIGDYPGLFPKRGIWERAPAPEQSATATVGTIGTITLTAPVATAYQNTSSTGTVGTIGTITLTAPTCQAGESNTATVSTIGTITLTAPVVTAYAVDNVATVGDIGIIYLIAPTVYPILERPPNAYNQQFYWGKHARGQYLNILFEPLYIPDDIPVVKFWKEGTDLVRTMSLPVTDVEDVTFGQAILLDDDFEDGHYIAVAAFDVDHVPYCTVNYFEVIGGSFDAPITAISEISRPLGQAVVSFRGDGVAEMGYNPSIFEQQE